MGICNYYGDCPFNTDCEEDNPHYKCRHRVTGKKVRIKYWSQETVESGSWCLTGLMSFDAARKCLNNSLFELSEIVEDSEYAGGG